jgi:VanZ family protein
MEPQLSDMFATRIQILSAEDKLTPYSWKALAGSVIRYCMDGFDTLILGFMLATISSDLALTNSQAGSLVTWTLVGAVAGGVLFGTLSDHFGRIRILTWTILIFAVFAVFAFLCGFARGYWDLVAYRVIAGLGLGGADSESQAAEPNRKSKNCPRYSRHPRWNESCNRREGRNDQDWLTTSSFTIEPRWCAAVALLPAKRDGTPSKREQE